VRYYPNKQSNRRHRDTAVNNVTSAASRCLEKRKGESLAFDTEKFGEITVTVPEEDLVLVFLQAGSRLPHKCSYGDKTIVTDFWFVGLPAYYHQGRTLPPGYFLSVLRAYYFGQAKVARSSFSPHVVSALLTTH